MGIGAFNAYAIGQADCGIGGNLLCCSGVRTVMHRFSKNSENVGCFRFCNRQEKERGKIMKKSYVYLTVKKEEEIQISDIILATAGALFFGMGLYLGYCVLWALLG